MIKVNQLSKSFKTKKVLSNIDYQFNEGQIYGIQGDNGSGKSVFFKLLSGLMMPNEGSIEVLGKQVGVRGRMVMATGVLIENPGFLHYLSGLENLKLLASIQNKTQESQILELLNVFDLSDAVHMKVGHYSIGMKQKLGIIQAIMEEPRILLLDEPFNGLDDSSRNLTKSILLEYSERYRATILITSHVLSDLEGISDTFLKIESHKLIPNI